MLSLKTLFGISALALAVNAAPGPAVDLHYREAPAVSPSVSAISHPPAPGPSAAGNSSTGAKKYIAYWSIWHARTQTPTAEQLKGVTHLILSFADLSIEGSPQWALNGPAQDHNGWVKSDVEAIQAQGIKVGVAVGGWNLDDAFRPRSLNDGARDSFAKDMIAWCTKLGLDGIDLDWEYPVNNGAKYRTTRQKDLKDADNYVALAQVVRKQLDAYGTANNKTPFLSIAVPSKPIDIDECFNATTVKGLDPVIDHWNLMSYDFINRRDNQTGHHAGATVIQQTFKKYSDLGIAKNKLMIGFPMYAKWFEIQGTCTNPNLVGCDFGVLHEEFSNGADRNNSGSVTYNQAVVDNPAKGTEFMAFAAGDHSDKAHHASTYISTSDSTATSLASTSFWTWLSPNDMLESCKANLADAGGIMVWSINQDDAGAAGGTHFKALQTCLGL